MMRSHPAKPVRLIGLYLRNYAANLAGNFIVNKLIPVFFPAGRLTAVPGTLKISILRRIRVLFPAGTNVPLILLVGTIGFAVWEVQDYAVSAGVIEYES